MTPTLEVERSLLDSGSPGVIGCDEVGRGAIAGPVTVGMVFLTAIRAHPQGLRDSKLLTERRREQLLPEIAAWPDAHAVGEATSREIDEVGIIAAMGLAARRAFTELTAQRPAATAATVILDGGHDWLSVVLPANIPVQVRVKADRDCATVAAASVIAKVHRDGGMRAAHATEPSYNWADNKGYASAAHRVAIQQHGVSALHRISWRITPE